MVSFEGLPARRRVEEKFGGTVPAVTVPYQK
jgi:hypothetical protein